MSPKNEDYGPGLAPALFLAVLTFFIGVLLGTASMVSREVRVLNRNTNLDDLEPGTVYHIKGDRLRAAAWEAKEQAIISGLNGTLSLTESELNQWSLRRLRIEAPANPDDDSGWMDKLEITATPLDFRIVDDQLLISAELTMPGILGNRGFLYQAKGNLVNESGNLTFVPLEGTLGCAPLGQIPGIKDFLFESVVSLYLSTEPGKWLPDTLSQIKSASITGDQLVLSRN